MNLLLVPSLQSCECIFFTDTKIQENIVLEISQSFAETVFLSPLWKDITNIYFVSGPASFTTLRNMAVFLQTVKQFSQKAEQKTYIFYNISNNTFLKILSSSLPSSHKNMLLLYSVGKRETFIFEKQKYTKIKNKNITTEIEAIHCAGFLSQNICEILEKNNIAYTNFETHIPNLLDIQTLISEENKRKYSSDISIDYGALPMLNPPC